jgi:hypothetical protein
MSSRSARPTQITALFFAPGQWRAAKSLAKKTRASAAAIVRQALAEYLNRQSSAASAKT